MDDPMRDTLPPPRRSASARLAPDAVESAVAQTLLRLMRATERLSDQIVDVKDWVSSSLTDGKLKQQDLEARQQRLYDIITPRFNEFFRSEDEARMAWEVYKVLIDEPVRRFPGDLPCARGRAGCDLIPSNTSFALPRVLLSSSKRLTSAAPRPAFMPR